jgi:D-arabinono-1,4-lactone oxidase
MRGFATKVEEWFGEDLETFKKIRREQDPHNVFLNAKDWAVRNGIVDIDEVN